MRALKAKHRRAGMAWVEITESSAPAHHVQPLNKAPLPGRSAGSGASGDEESDSLACACRASVPEVEEQVARSDEGNPEVERGDLRWVEGDADEGN